MEIERKNQEGETCDAVTKMLRPTIPIPSSGFSETDRRSDSLAGWLKASASAVALRRRPSRDESFSNFYTCARARLGRSLQAEWHELSTELMIRTRG